MNPVEENRIQRLLDLLEEQRVVMERAMLTSLKLEKELRFRLNEDLTVKA